MNIKITRIVFSFIVIAFISNTIQAQVDSLSIKNKQKPTTWQLLKTDGGAAWGGLKYAYSRPLHWKKKQWLTAGAVVGGTALLYLVDDNTNRYFRKQNTDVPPFLKKFGWRSGSPQIAYGVTGSVYMFGLLTKNEKVRKTGVLMITSATAAGFIQTFAKAAVGRARPGAGLGKDTFKPYSGEARFRSFPSGHTILAFTAAYSIGKQFDNPWAKAGIYAVGMIAPVSRLWSGAHWLTDVALSMAISVATVDAIDRYLNTSGTYNNTKKGTQVSWNLNVGVGQIGLVGTF